MRITSIRRDPKRKIGSGRWFIRIWKRWPARRVTIDTGNESSKLKRMEF